MKLKAPVRTDICINMFQTTTNTFSELSLAQTYSGRGYISPSVPLVLLRLRLTVSLLQSRVFHFHSYAELALSLCSVCAFLHAELQEPFQWAKNQLVCQCVSCLSAELCISLLCCATCLSAELCQCISLLSCVSAYLC